MLASNKLSGLMTDNSTLSTRQETILDYAKQHGEVLVDPLAVSLNVTPQTIRKDLNVLCQRRLLQRVHGGAIIQDGVENVGYQARKRLSVPEKAAIGRRAAELIGNDSSMFINIGTTTEQVAEYLKHHIGLLVITNNFNVIDALRHSESIEVVTASGTVRREDGGIVGASTAEFISQFKVDYAVIGASAIDEDGAILDYDFREVRVARAIIENARSVILVADSLKFQRQAPVRIGDVSQVDYFITDVEPPAGFNSICEHHGVRVEIAQSEVSAGAI